MSNVNYSILVNTCDKFEDCWDPFFKLWSIYWPDCKATIYLNTEYKEYSYEGLNIVALKVCERNNFPKNQRATWSQCFEWALNAIETDVVLYLQEDYFLKDTVQNDIVAKYVHFMSDNENMKCIHLTDQGIWGRGASEYENLDNAICQQKNRVSCQAALWRKSELLDLLRDYESGWEFEEFGSMRSAILKSNYYVINRDYVKLDQFEIIPYVFTGVVQGRWYEKVVPLFKKHNIKMDFSKRGFLNDAPSRTLMKRVSDKLNKIPKIYRNKKDLNRLSNSREK
ncbi:Glycosyl transferase [Zobellia roscoffensis]|uniref:hypothetical protein n=1 Tax=Zobellia roscoffensis TaxID=2779508 RepID=UPI00188CF7C0|nr:hypothetical protein [Zobellia roscoffensis]